MLKWTDIWGVEHDRVKTAIDRLKMFEPPEGYYLAYSGGKDSDTILALAKMAGVKFDAHYNLTTVDPPEVVYHVRKHPEVQTNRPAMTMWQLIRYNKIMPTRVARFCCRALKERGGSNRVVVTGVRAQESIRRSRRKMNEVCYNDPTRRFLHVIIDWSGDDVWEFIRTNNIEYCKLYDEGWKRLGCVMCPFSNIKLGAEKYPKIAEAYRRAINRAFQQKRKIDSRFKDADDMFNWWISGRSAKEWSEKDTSFWAYE
jgi:phosphoadenosine phosphosulfate reductase